MKTQDRRETNITVMEFAVTTAYQRRLSDCNDCRRMLDLEPVEMPPTNCRSAKEIGNLYAILDEIQLRKETH